MLLVLVSWIPAFFLPSNVVAIWMLSSGLSVLGTTWTVPRVLRLLGIKVDWIDWFARYDPPVDPLTLWRRFKSRRSHTRGE
jgi:hypothetical protein